ncbi:MAG: hypothetical protein IPM42_15500 [Saprospiraceae bacterium]|nr:hypothetical protein [Saprospiraceae bacterium]
MKTGWKNAEWLWATGSMLLCFCIAYPIFGPYFFQPNQHMYAFGGDALAIYYDMAYHICHGDGHIFRGMNYPHGELIFLTDAQGALTMLLQWINHHIIEICDYSIGIVHAVNVWLILFCALVMYLLLRSLKVCQSHALIFAPLITMLSPQIFRMGGHFGLAYPFLIPLAMLWMIRKYRIQKAEWRDVGLFVVLIFFTFNNPYVGAGTSGFLIAAGFLIYVKKRLLKPALLVSLMGLVSVLLPLIYFKTFDPVDDRIKLQWGFFTYYAKLEGMFAAPGSHMDQIIRLVAGKGFNVGFESLINVGFVTTILLITYLIFRYFKKSFVFRFQLSDELSILFWGAGLILIYASAFIFMGFDKEFVEEKLGFLLMFKAVARLAWPFYFACTILSVCYLHHINSRQTKSKAFITFILAAAIWCSEIFTYIKPNFENTKHANFFSKEKDTDVLTLLEKYNIDIQKYQAILCLPKMMMWSDNFLSELNFNTQFYSMQISKTTGIPLVNSMLSRLSVGQTAEAIELLADPLIYKSLPSKFPDQRPLLLLLGAGHPSLRKGEKFLSEIADTVMSNENITLFSLPLDRINNNSEFKKAVERSEDSTFIQQNYWTKDFEKESTPYAYFGAGAGLFEKGTHLILDTIIQNPPTHHYIFSGWIRFDNKRYGMGSFRYIIKDNSDNIIFDEKPDTRHSNDIQNDWIRVEKDLPVLPGHRIMIYFVSETAQYIDELILRTVNTEIIKKADNKVLYNGFRLDSD